MSTPRRMTPVDHLVAQLDQGLRTVFGRPHGARPSPAEAERPTELSHQQQAEAVGLMRVNHAGEVAAQALYQGQALTARNPATRRALEQAAAEENDHLAWCRKRLDELGGQTSRLDPLWYAGSFCIGAIAGLAGDRVSLGFLAETERQVVAHLEGHLERLPAADGRSRAVLEQMKTDEAGHATTAMEHGGIAVPGPVQSLMRRAARVMTRTAYWL